MMEQPKLANPEHQETAKCRGCQADIRWVLSEKTGSRMPLDAKPEQRIILIDEPDGIVARVVPTYVSHFATCTVPDQFRKRK